jgi:hypothetical protein
MKYQPNDKMQGTQKNRAPDFCEPRGQSKSYAQLEDV